MTTNTNRERRPLVELRAGEAVVRIDLDHGARIAELHVSGHDLLVEPPEPRDGSIGWGSFLMAPWPGRLAQARLRWRGRAVQLPRTHGANAIHGLVHAVPWRVDRLAGSELAVSVELGPLDWPFGGRVRQRLKLEADSLTMVAEIEADAAMPAALGWHPWFRRGGTDVRLRVDADAVLERRSMIPTGRVLPVRGPTDLRAGPRLGRRRLDDTYVGARSPAVVRWPDLELRLEFPGVETVVVFSPRDALCVEPQTAWPNALGFPRPADRAGAGARSLEPGESLEATFAIRWTR